MIFQTCFSLHIDHNLSDISFQENIKYFFIPFKGKEKRETDRQRQRETFKQKEREWERVRARVAI